MKKLLFGILLMSPGIALACIVIYNEIIHDHSKQVGATLGLIVIMILFVFGIKSLIDWYVERYG